MTAAGQDTDRKLVLAVDDNQDALYALKKILEHNGYDVATFSPAEEGSASVLDRIRESNPAVVLLDVMMPSVNGYDVARAIKSDPELKIIPVILVTAKASLEDIIFGLNQGADDYIAKPFRPEELLARLRATVRLREVYSELLVSKEANTRLLNTLSSRFQLQNIVGKSPAMDEVFSLMKKVTGFDSPVLITGPSGTGKELVAQAIHFNSARREFPFIPKNCAAFSEHLIESELFGHLKGSFTGAQANQKGLFEAAEGGTLFLDEIGELPLPAQAKLLRVLQDKTFTPLGSTQSKRADVRVIAATNRNLMEMVENGKFREDLYFRLNVIEIKLPPLIDRKSDIAPLVEYFLASHASSRGVSAKSVADEVIQAFENYSWRGNVRELENEIERMLIIGGESDCLGLEFVSQRIVNEWSAQTKPGEGSGTLRTEVERVERNVIADALKKSGGNKSVAAKELGISRSNLIAKVQYYNLERK